MHAITPQDSPAKGARPLWQAELARGFARTGPLLEALGLSAAECGVDSDADLAFPLRVPRGFVARMAPGDPRDPLLLQVLPTRAEAIARPGFTQDPVGDLASVRVPGLLQKYAGRALLVTTGACAVHCRYCFRREYPYGDHSASGGQLETALAAVAADPALEEIILSGGDPLVLSEQRLEFLVRTLDGMDHVQRIRIHTRVPVVLPERVDARLLRLLGGLRTRVVMVLHANHAREIDAGVAAALRTLGSVTGPLLNQAVLLRGINDSVAALTALSRAVFGAGALPYYLHQLDPVAGAAHFAVPDAEAMALVAGASARLPGYLVPRLVREHPGAAAKTLLGPFGAT